MIEMKWVATEDVGTCEVTEFEPVDDMSILWLMDGYKVDTSNPKHICVREMEDGHHVLHDGVIYRGGFGVNLWVTRKYREL